MKQRVIVYFILFQIALISIISYQIYKKKTSVLGTKISVNPIKKEEQIFPKVDGLKYFYEPKPDSVSVINLDWENTNGPEHPTYKINSDGLNQITNFIGEKPEGVFRIAAIGDSFTFGENVNTEDNYPSQLQNLLDKQCNNKFEVLNLGVVGYDIRYVVERYKLRGQKYDPDLILWFIIPSDLLRIDELVIPKYSYLLKKMKENGEYQEKIKKGDFYSSYEEVLEEVVNDLGGEDKVSNLQKEYFQEFNRYFNKKLLIFTLPNSENKYKSFLQNIVSSRPNTLFSDEIAPIYSAKDTHLPDLHPSPIGYKLIMNNLFEFLTKNRIIPCSI